MEIQRSFRSQDKIQKCVVKYSTSTAKEKELIYYPESFRQFPLDPSVKARWGQTSESEVFKVMGSGVLGM